MTITDPVAHTMSAERSGWASALIRDERDAPLVHLLVSMAAVMLPLAALMYVPGVFRWWLAAIYEVVLIGLFLDRFILMLHNASHRRLFRKGVRLGWVIPWLLGPLAGQTPGTYFAHHIGMHHPENNLASDTSSTMRYRRDSAWDFGRYLGRFLVLGVAELAVYFFRRRRSKLLRQALIGELVYIGVVAILFAINWQATLVVFLFPLAFARFGMMAGNWAQHAFVDPRDPANPFRNSITSINTRYNRRCFNDGYHIGHHRQPTRHWTDMPRELSDNIELYRREDAIVFDGLDYFQIWALLMVRAYGRLADHVVPLGPARDRDAIMDLLRSRTVPIDA